MKHNILLFLLLYVINCTSVNAQMFFGEAKAIPDSVFNSLALTPPMGWNSWNKFGCDVSEKLMKEMADAW